MLEDNFARAIAACAPGKRVTVTFASGKRLALPIAAEPPPPPNPIDVLSEQLRERDAATAEIGLRTTDAIAAMKDAVDGLATELAQGVKEIVGTLHLPVVPTKYDKDGRIIEARRKEKP